MSKKQANGNYAAIDLGTNSVRMLIVNRYNHVILSSSERVRLGEGGYLNDNNFTDEAIKRTVDAFIDFRKIIDKNNVIKIRAVGTAACRNSKNVDVLIDKIYKETNIKLEVISGEEEARLSSLGASIVLENSQKPVLFCDIGGGSTELIWAKKARTLDIINSVSIPFGATRIIEDFRFNQFNENSFLKIKDNFEPKLLGFISENNINSEDFDFIGISGFALRIASILNNTGGYNREKAHGLSFSKESFIENMKIYEKMKENELNSSIYIGKDRGSSFISGYALFSLIFNNIAAKKCVASLSGIKEAVALELISQN